jgi:hypothetical protein
VTEVMTTKLQGDSKFPVHTHALGVTRLVCVRVCVSSDCMTLTTTFFNQLFRVATVSMLSSPEKHICVLTGA